MKFKYYLILYSMPEYYEGNCQTLGIYDCLETAYAAKKQLDAANNNEDNYYEVVVEEQC